MTPPCASCSSPTTILRCSPAAARRWRSSLFRCLRDRHGAEGLFLAGVTGALRERKPGTLVQAAGPAADELLVSLDHFDRFFLAQEDIYGLA